MLKLKGVVLVLSEAEPTSLKVLMENQGFSTPTKTAPKAVKKIGDITITVSRNDKKEVLVGTAGPHQPEVLTYVGYKEIRDAGVLVSEV